MEKGRRVRGVRCPRTCDVRIYSGIWSATTKKNWCVQLCDFNFLFTSKVRLVASGGGQVDRGLDHTRVSSLCHLELQHAGISI